MNLLPLPNMHDVEFISGSTQTFRFVIFDKECGNPIDLTSTDITINWIIFPYHNAKSVVYTKTNKKADEIKVVDRNQIVVSLKSIETARLSGKYVHRIIITDNMGNNHIPSEGYITVIK